MLKLSQSDAKVTKMNKSEITLNRNLLLWSLNKFMFKTTSLLLTLNFDKGDSRPKFA